ncbi:lytic transglycosylase domain-containing protein [bacterium]|nr:lytic transglycosylase domain-containing protein [bacterium]
MTGAISGLDITLHRMSEIERGFQTLLSRSQTEVPVAQPDFQKILDKSVQLEKNTQNKSTNASKSREEIDNLIEEYSAKHGLDSDFVKAVVRQESGFNPNAKSKCGAMGLMQLMPATAKGLGVTNAFDAEQNIYGGTKYLKGLLDRFDNNKELALAAYNAGPNAVKKYKGIPPYAETQNYVKSIMKSYDKLKGAQL